MTKKARTKFKKATPAPEEVLEAQEVPEPATGLSFDHRPLTDEMKAMYRCGVLAAANTFASTLRIPRPVMMDLIGTAAKPVQDFRPDEWMTQKMNFFLQDCQKVIQAEINEENKDRPRVQPATDGDFRRLIVERGRN